MTELIRHVQERGLRDALVLVETTLADPELTERLRAQWLGAKAYLLRDLEANELQQLQNEAEAAQALEMPLPDIEVEAVEASSASTEMSPEAKAERRPPPPEYFVDALQDRVHVEIGHLISSTPIVKPERTEALNDQLRDAWRNAGVRWDE